MKYIYPDYYKDFECIKGECKHNCCIGWEIDIDDTTAQFYKSVSGEMGERLNKSISFEEQPHFILGENERCPFLNKDNLCDIIINLGEEHLCEICADHPRFRNELPDRTEVGLGLSCEAAARLIIDRNTPMTLTGETQTDDEIIILRDKIISILQNRSIDIFERMQELLKACNTEFDFNNLNRFFDTLFNLERLDVEWTKTLATLKNGYDKADFNGFNTYIKNRITEYEQLAVYFIYRHFANAFDEESIKERARFAVFAVCLIYAIGAVLWTKNGNFEKNEQIEIIRQFSSEIEYSDENLYILFEESGM